MSKSMRQSRRESMISRAISQNYRDLPLIEQEDEARNASDVAWEMGNEVESNELLCKASRLCNANVARRQAARDALHAMPQEYQAAGEDNAGSSFVDMAQERGCWNKHPRAIECCEYWELALASARDSMQGDGYDQQAAQYAADESAAGLERLADAALGR